MSVNTERGKRVYEIYKALGFRAYIDFAKRLGVSKAAVGQWFNGKAEPDPKHLIKLMMSFPEINKNYLLFGQKPIFENTSTLEFMEQKRQIEMLQRENERLREMISSLVNTVDVLHKFYKIS